MKQITPDRSIFLIAQIGLNLLVEALAWVTQEHSVAVYDIYWLKPSMSSFLFTSIYSETQAGLFKDFLEHVLCVTEEDQDKISCIWLLMPPYPPPPQIKSWNTILKKEVSKLIDYVWCDIVQALNLKYWNTRELKSEVTKNFWEMKIRQNNMFLLFIYL